MKIYLVTNKVNGKQYVGQTVGPVSRRWRKHRHTGYALHNAIRKYGRSSFVVEIIDTAETIEELNDLERQWISKLNTISPSGYNLQSGGDNYIPSEESRRRMAAAQIGTKAKKSTREKMSRSQKIAQMRPRVRREKSKRMRGKNNPFFGKSHTKETRRKISKRRKGKGGRAIRCIEEDRVYQSIAEAARELGLDASCISKVARGKRNHTDNYTFVYEDEL